MALDVLQQLLAPSMSTSYRDGYTQLEGYAVRLGDIASFARDTASTIDAHGNREVAGGYSPDGAYVDVLRFVLTPLHRAETAAGGNDLDSPAFEGRVFDFPPFTGNGFAASQSGIVPLWRLGRDRLPPGAELHRIRREGGSEFLGAYRDVATGWIGPAVTPAAASAVASGLVGMRAQWHGGTYLADLVPDGQVTLAAVGDTVPPEFEAVRPGLARRTVARAEVGTIDEAIVTCTWRGEPFEVVGRVGGPDDQMRLTYSGRNSFTARSMGLEFVQPGVYEITVARAEIADVGGLTRELPPA